MRWPRSASKVGAINQMNAQVASVSVPQTTVADDVAQSINRIHKSTVQSSFSLV
jgi:methyl-accepting chemotaxis protein